MTRKTSNCGRSLQAVAAAGVSSLALLAAGSADARITRIDMSAEPAPAFEGTSFGDVGQYEKLTGTVHGEVDPKDPLNAIITDIENAPTNADGLVEYSADIYILRPADPAKGNHRIFYDLNNRGGMRAMRINDGENEGDPQTAADAGNGFLMREGYTILSSGWDAMAPTSGNNINLTVPVAVNADGSSIVGPSMEEWVVDDDETMSGDLTYPPASLDQSGATLYKRTEAMGDRTEIPASSWTYGEDGMSVSLLPEGTPFEAGTLYDFVYQAKDPIVAGLGFAAIRDVADFLRNAESDDSGNANPLAGDVEKIYTFCVSQPCRLMNDYIYLGFNETEDHGKALDGVLNWVGGGDGIFMNYRFAQTFRTSRQRQARWFPEFLFPFADVQTTDPVSGRTDSRLARCEASDTCPLIMQTNSDNEYWAKDMAVLHVAPDGSADLPEPENVRYYLMASLPHGAGSGKGMCAFERNPLVPYNVHRALLVALDGWATDGAEPPASRMPRLSDGTLVASMPQDSQGFPQIPGVAYNGRQHTGDLFDFGSGFEDGIITTLPPVLVDSPYPSLVPATDEDGNTVAGVRIPEVAVPVATFTGWNRRSGVPEEDCGGSGMVVPFAATEAERDSSGDPRTSIAERYPTQEAYVQAVSAAASGLMADGFLLQEDVDRYVEQAGQSMISN